ncbi:hypothetical protein [Mesorhizobium sp.]|uniref:hypothetical protein n=1 Tax=Mesorhizobium sp. TaxID=1871066 RepID=UPI000FE67DE5|nr:hypothetical protein [Mesorhizobium sp.]RWG00450.1 MAG: hypothetical protein EOQ54_26595 [Mesorhizobium sp.]RWG95546.1 MAG: hypothetical protein EOQ72_24295 [Mesorhizobium sp.]
MFKAAVAWCLLELMAQPSLAGDFGGLTLSSTCEDYNASAVADRVGFVHDVLVRTSTSSGKDYLSRRVDIQACVAATYAPPCVSDTTTMREVIAVCMLMGTSEE